jgi:hypothetical protein
VVDRTQSNVVVASLLLSDPSAHIPESATEAFADDLFRTASPPRVSSPLGPRA